MWKKSKRILSCILALMLLLSLANNEQLFVQADTESAERVQTENVKNKSQKQVESLNETGKEESADKKRESSIKTTQKIEESKKEEKNNQETTTQEEQNISKNEESKEETEEKTEENKGEEEKTEIKSEENTKGEEASTEIENSDTTKDSEEKEKTEQVMETEAEEETQEQETEGGQLEELQPEEQEPTEETMETTTQLEKQEKEYIPESQPEGVVIKAYAMEGVFPEKTVLKVKSLGEKELSSAENVLKKGNVKYEGLFGYDISFYDKTGKEIEPENGSVRVVMQISDKILPEDADTDTLTIQHLAQVRGDYDAQKVASIASGSMQINSGKIKAEYSVDSFSEFVVTYSNVNTSKWKTEVKFYINKNSYIANSSSGGNGDTMKENFTGSVGSSKVSMPEDADTYPYTIEEASDGKSTAYIVIQGDQTGSAYAVDQKIRNLPDTPYDGFSVEKIPSDAEVLEKIKTGTVDVKVNGHVVNASDLTTDNFQVRWYVLKYNTTDQWHIDGILVPKSGRLKITKTFKGLSSDDISQLSGHFAINVAGTTSYGDNQYSLSLDKGTASSDKKTYTWEMDVYNTTYTVKETGMDLDNWTMEATYSTNPDASSGQEAVKNEKYKDGFSIKCITKAKDVGSGEQSATLENTYVRKKAALKVTKTITINGKKVDNVTIQNLQFEIRDEKGDLVKTLSINDFTKNKDGTYEYSNPEDKFLEAGKTYTITEKNTALDGYIFNNKEEECSKTITVTKNDNNKEKEVAFVNDYTKNIVPPTGASTTMTAWILMTGVTLMLAVSFIVFDIRRKRFLS